MVKGMMGAHVGGYVLNRRIALHFTQGLKVGQIIRVVGGWVLSGVETWKDETLGHDVLHEWRDASCPSLPSFRIWLLGLLI